MTATNLPINGKQKRVFVGDIFGWEIEFEYSAATITYAVFGLRIVMGWIFLQAGLDKFFAGDWSAAGFLNNAIHEGNPFLNTFHSMAGNGLVDALNVWGQILIGFALIFGILVRWSAFWGAVMMIFYWAASLQGGLTEFLPLEHGWVVDDHLVYAVLLFALGALGAGRVLGLDALLEKTPVFKENRWLGFLLG